MSLEVTRKTIPDILSLLKSGEWQVPQFQRDFIWSYQQVKQLVRSVLNSYPIGLVTIWEQPQDEPHTPGEPLRLKYGATFKDYEKSPALIKLILDGKQRLTSLAMVFGGFCSESALQSFSGQWFLDLDAYTIDPEGDYIRYKKRSEIAKEQIDTLANRVQKAMVAFRDFERLSDYIERINDPEVYADGAFPEKSIREDRVTALKSFDKGFQAFQIPVAEIPRSIELGDVCEIFDVLNTTGTKVSIFDLLHNILFKKSDGAFLLRDKFKASYSELPKLGLLCDESRPEFLCQIITGCYLMQAMPLKASAKIKEGEEPASKDLVSSLKGTDLLDTPLSFYNDIDRNALKIDTYAADLFSQVLEGDFKLTELPYPVAIILYIALRWRLEFRSGTAPYTQIELNKAFKAFFWRNTFTNRYDQGFLTKFATDLKFLDRMLSEAHGKTGQQWASSINDTLEKHFGADYKLKTQTELKDIVASGDVRGATRQALSMILASHARHDLLTGEQFDWSLDKGQKKVQLHHIFPKAWVRDNEGSLPEDENTTVESFANLTPLTAESNNTWKAKGPATAIKTLDLAYNTSKSRYDEAFITNRAFNHLSEDKTAEFWEDRSNNLAEFAYGLLLVE